MTILILMSSSTCSSAVVSLPGQNKQQDRQAHLLSVGSSRKTIHECASKPPAFMMTLCCNVGSTLVGECRGRPPVLWCAVACRFAPTNLDRLIVHVKALTLRCSF